jgi:ABC-type multidrug transport system ATPase subunit
LGARRAQQYLGIMGSGIQQFFVLLRKNLLLKTRRPYASLFEVTLPVALFLLLAYARTRYEIRSYGPYDFDTSSIFPLSRRLFTDGESGVNSVDWYDYYYEEAELRQEQGRANASTATNTTNDTNAAGDWLRDIEQDLLCSSTLQKHMDDVLVRILNVEVRARDYASVVEEAAADSVAAVSKDVEHTSLAHELVSTSTSDASRWVQDLLSQVRSWDTNAFQRHFDDARKKYLSSSLKKQAEHWAKRVDDEAHALHKCDANEARRRTESWVEELCTLSGPLFEVANKKKLSNDLVNLRDMADEWGLPNFLDGGGRLAPVHWILNSVDADPEVLSRMFSDVIHVVSNWDADHVAETADDAIWWLSHFLRSRSVVARLLGEYDSDMNWSAVVKQGSSLNGPELRTDAAGAALEGLRRLQKASRDVEKSTESLAERGEKEADQAFERSADEAKKAMELPLERVHDLLDRLADRTAENIEKDVLPEWEGWWKRECPKALNKTIVGEWAMKTHSKCPFYRSLIKNAGDVQFEKRMQNAHRALQEWDSAGIAKHAKHWQHALEEINGNDVGRGVARVIAQVQKMHRGSNLDMPTSLGSSYNDTDGVAIAKTLGKALRKEWARHRGLKPCDDNKAIGSNAKDAETATTTQATAFGVASPTVVPPSHRTGNGTTQTNGAKDMFNSGGNFLNGLGDECKNKNPGVNDYLRCEIYRRKILVSPYKGETKQLVDSAIVELALSITDLKHTGRDTFLSLLLRCPLVRGALAKFAELTIKERMLTFGTERELEEYARNHPNDVLGALAFRSADTASGNFPPGPLAVDYAVRVHAQLLPPTSRILRISRRAMFGASSGGDTDPYEALYILHLQEAFGRAAARLRALREAAAPGSQRSEVGRNIYATNQTEPGRRLAVGIEQFPAPQYQYDGYIRIIQHQLPMLLILGWIYAVSLLVKEVVYEKQERLRDVMRIMGLKTWVYWSSWWASAMIQLSMFSGIMTFIMSTSKVLKYSDPSLVYCLLLSFSIATVSLAMLISSFFNRAKVAAACGGLFYYTIYFPYLLFNRFEDLLSLWAKCGFCLFSSTGMGVAASILAKWELVEEGIQWSNLFNPVPVTYSGAAPKDNFSLAHVMGMFIVDAVIYQVLAWYVEKVSPGTFGLPQPFYFPILPSYWLPQIALVEMMDKDGCGNERSENSSIEYWEAPTAGSSVSVAIRKLEKVFGGGGLFPGRVQKAALKGISLDIHRGTILGLLGHNGAGKSTTMAILNGLYPPSAGDVHVNGVSVSTDSHGVRKQLGVCLQHNALYENLTVEEHLRLFCCLKGVSWSCVSAGVQTLLTDTGLLPKRYAASKALSGGMKRKLSIGIALAGGSSVVTLDEPTAGVDATSRRDIWQLLTSYKKEKTILLSTHFMDEADILSDRIAIIAEGELTAIGSGMGLKSHFTDGYSLTVVLVDGAEVSELTDMVQRQVPDAVCQGCRGREVSYLLPYGSRGRFSLLFSWLQDKGVQIKHGIDTYGLSAATMEEVFLKASSVHEHGLHGQVRNAVNTVASEGDEGSSNNPPSEGTDESTRSGSTPDHSVDRVQTTTAGSPSESSGTSTEKLEPESVEDVSLPSEKAPSDLLPPVPISSPAWPPPEPTKTKAKMGPQKKQAMHEAIANDMTEPPVVLHSGPVLAMLQFGAMMRKRALSARRDRKAWASQLLLPIAFVFLAMLVAVLLAVKEDLPALKLSTDMYIGTVGAGYHVQELPRHQLPFANTASNEYGDSVGDAFRLGGSRSNTLQHVGANSTMFSYLMAGAEAKALSGSYGAVSVGKSPRGGEWLTLWFKNRAYHATPVMMNLWNNARMRLIGYDDVSVQMWAHPLPKTEVLLQEEMTGSNQIFTDLMVAITTILALGFIPASFVVYVVHEKASNAKHQQLLTGISPTMYWLTTYIWDLLNYILPLACCTLLFNWTEAYGGDNTMAMIVLVFLYGACMTPHMYCLERLFTVPSTAYVTLICLNIFTGTVSVMATTIMDLFEREVPDLVLPNQICKAIFPWLLPNYCLGCGMINIAMNHYVNYAAKHFGVCVRGPSKCIVDPFTWDVSGRFLFHLALMAVGWMVLRLLIEWGFCLRGLRKRTEDLLRAAATSAPATDDDAVAQENKRVNEKMVAARASGTTPSDQLIIHDLTKSFSKLACCRRRGGPVHAVRGVSVGVPAGECFGLLGVNGAGKTTTMRMITGDTEIGSGDVLVSGCSVHGQRDKARRHLGYCPQFDALPDKLTARETLALYARIRGVQREELCATVESMITRMCLEAHQHTMCEHLSGGNKRKLSTAMALIGDPDVVLLDEPSTGVDVGARRFLWDVIGGISRSGRAVVLTSHSMDECEVLCTRLTIMAQGQMKCLGSPLQLKAKYGDGYTLAIKTEVGNDVNGTDQSSLKVQAFIAENFPDAVLAEKSVGLHRYRFGSHLSGSNGDAVATLTKIFHLLEAATANNTGALSGCATDYSVSQTTLEEVFLHFSQDGLASNIGDASLQCQAKGDQDKGGE